MTDVTDEERSFWSFQPLARHSLPAVKQASSLESPIDAFLLEELEKHELGFSSHADKATLVRRAFFDLHGLEGAFANFNGRAELVFLVGDYEHGDRKQMLELGITEKTFRLGCAPVINLFEQTGDRPVVHGGRGPRPVR